VELPPEWGPGQVIISAWIRAGYDVDEVRSLAAGERRMIVHGGSGSGLPKLRRAVGRFSEAPDTTSSK
jgi:hypothetical protein